MIKVISCMKSIDLKSNARARGAGRDLASASHPANGGLVLYHTKAENSSNYRLINSLIQSQKSNNNTSIRLAYNRKIVIYGDYFDLYSYPENRYLFNKKTPSSSKIFKEIDHDNKISYIDFSWFKQRRRTDSISRSRNNVTRIIQCNIDVNPTQIPVFVTLTFKKNIKNIKSANYQWKLFIQRLNYYLSIKSKYITVIEFQKRGAVHYHSVFFNLPYVPKEKLMKTWGQGFSRIEVPKNIKDVTKYVGKYMSKELLDKRLVGQKAFFTSKGLLRPIHTFNPDVIDNILDTGNINLIDEFRSVGVNIKKYKYA